MFHHNWIKTTGHVLDSRIRTMHNPRVFTLELIRITVPV